MLLINAVVLNVYRRDNFDHPAAAVVAVGGMALWTVFSWWAYSSAARRTPALLGADLAVAMAGLLVTPWLKGSDFNATLAGFWVMGAMFAWAIQWRLAGGLAAASVLSVTDLLLRDQVTQTNYGNVFLLMIGGPIVGYLADSLQRSAVAQASAEREAAREAERARLARTVHDGVLQVLALVQRRGAEIGGDTAELGRLAGEQETRLRGLIRAQDSALPPQLGGSVDLAVELARLEERGSVTVATPGTSVPVPAAVAEELMAAVSACLDNVALHVGRDAPAWVLLEVLPDSLVVSVRDEGPGIPAGRLELAAAEGRLGVVESIRGRLSDLGGSATVTTGSFGTEWELVLPRARC